MTDRTSLVPAAPPRWTIAGFLVAVGAMSATLFAQTPATPPNPTVIRRLALGNVETQRTTANQRLLQGWILWNARAYQQQLFGTAIGDARTPAGRRLVDFGNSDDYARAVIAAPVGQGRSQILWDTVGAPQFDPADNNIHFPRATFSMNGGAASTCWHELNHDLLDWHIGNLGRGVANPLPTPRIWGSMLNNDADEDHYVIEGLGERTMDWLYKLVIEQRFEKRIVAAAKDEAALRAAGKPVNWQGEHETWQKALKAWEESWPRAKSILPLPMSFRRVYDRYCGVSLPLPEDVQRFYMEGGVVDAAKTPIRVQEWVVAARRVLCDVTIDDKNRGAPRPVKKNMIGRVDLRLTENYKAKLQATRGQLVILLKTTDDAAFLDVSIGGKSLTGSADKARPGRLFEIDVAPFRDSLLGGKLFRVTLVRPLKGLHAKMKDKAYTIEALYRDPGKPASPSLYRPARAAIDMKIVAKDVPQPAAGVKGGSTPVKTSKAGGGKPKMRWLNDIERRKRSYWLLVAESHRELAKNETLQLTSTVSGGSGGAVIRWTQKDYRSGSKTKGQQMKVAATASWTAPPKRIDFGQKVPFAWSVAVKNWHTGAGLRFTFDGDGLRLSNKKRTTPQNPKSLSLGSFEGTLSGPMSPTQSLGGGTKLYVKFSTDAGWYQHMYQYKLVRGPEFVPDTGGGAPKPPKPPATPPAPPQFIGKVTRKLPPTPPPTPPELDNIPPKPGEVIGLTPPETMPPILYTPSPKWYTHPSGGYRFPLPSGWRIAATAPGGDTDVVTSANGALAILCGRDFGDISALADAPAVYAAHLQKAFPGAKVNKSTLAGATTLTAAVYNTNAHRMLWHQYLLKDKRAYYITVAAKPSKNQAPIPPAVSKALNAIVWHR